LLTEFHAADPFSVVLRRSLLAAAADGPAQRDRRALGADGNRTAVDFGVAEEHVTDVFD